MNRQIYALLESYNANTLWAIAQQTKLPSIKGTKPKKAALVKIMQEELFAPARIKAAYADLSKLEADVLNRVQLHGGAVQTRLLQRELVRAKLVTAAKPVKRESRNYYHRGPEVYGQLVDHVGTARPPHSTIFEDVLARLTSYGLLFSQEDKVRSGEVSYKFQLHPSTNVFIPTLVLRHLPAATPLPERLSAWQPTQTRQGTANSFLRNLYLYWDAIRRAPPATLKSGLVGKRGLKQLNAALLTPDASLKSASREDQTEQLYFWRRMAEELGLVQAQDNALRIVAENERAIPKFWLGTAVSQGKACLKAWQAIRQPGELGKEAESAMPQYVAARKMLVQFLKKASSTSWIECEDVLIALQDRSSNFLFPNRTDVERARGRGWYYSNFYGNDPNVAVRKMDQYEERFVRQAVIGFLFQLGLVDLGYDRATDDMAAWFGLRLTPLGKAVIQGGRLEEATADNGQIILQPNFQILAMGPVSLHLLAQLDLFAERKKAGETVFEYVLTRESVYAAQQLGMSVADVVDFLTKETPTDIPQNIRRSLQEWGAHHDRIVFRQGVTLLQAANGQLLNQLLADKHVGQYVAREAGTAVALVNTGKEKKLALALQAQDLLVARSGADPSAADSSITIQPDGVIHSVHAVPSLHLQGRLARFTEPTDRGWQLTEKSVAQASGDKEKTNVILAELKKLNRGRLAPDLVAQVKAWGGYYGAATVGTYTLVEFRDGKTLNELLKVTELKGKLRPFPAGERALAMVEEGELTAVRAVLSRLGVAISKA